MQGAISEVVNSMTGYSARDGADQGVPWSWEMRSVNARGLDLRLRLPDGLGALEAELRKRISARISRGAVTLSLKSAQKSDAQAASLDHEALTAALNALAEVELQAGAQGVHLAPSHATAILGLRGVFETGTGVSLPDPKTALADFEPLLEAFCTSRASEGAALLAILSSQLEQMTSVLAEAEVAVENRAQSHAQAFQANIARTLESSEIDPARLAQELAILAQKADVTEEIDRLKAHITAAKAHLAEEGPIGRKLDFLMQEFNREANTLCSKSGDQALTRAGLDLKLLIDQMREQVQNVE